MVNAGTRTLFAACAAACAAASSRPAGRAGAALNFVLYTMGGSVFMLIALLSLYERSRDWPAAIEVARLELTLDAAGHLVRDAAQLHQGDTVPDTNR